MAVLVVNCRFTTPGRLEARMTSLNAPSGLHRRAMEDELVLPGYNPVAALLERPDRSEREEPAGS